jgi:hypothetical protein
MVLRYYGVQSSSDAIRQAILKDEQGGSFNTEIARYARRLGFPTTCYGYNLYLTDPETDRTLTPGELVKRLERAAPAADRRYEAMRRSTVAYLREGGSYAIERPRLDLITSAVRAGSPAIVSVSAPALYGRRGDPFAGHDIVVIGVEDQTIVFIDPERGREDAVDGELLMFALLSRKVTAASAYLVAISPADRAVSVREVAA